MVSNYMPDVVVQIAFDGGFRVPKSSWTWTDVSTYVELGEGLSINWGRGDERSQADANTLTLTLDNSDGRFTAGKTSGAYYPNVVLYKPIRVLATPVDGSQSHRFLGYITSWPVEWEETDAYAKATITASSRLARLGLTAAWRSLIEETYLADSPVAYYPLGEPEGSTMAADVSGLGAAPLTLAGDPLLPVVFGQATGPGTDDLTAATFAGGQYLTGPQLGAATAVTWETFFLAGTIVEEFLGGIQGMFYVKLKASTEVSVVDAVTGSDVLTWASASWPDAGTHHYAVTITGTTWTLYVDGVSVDTGAGSAVTSGSTILLGYAPTSSGFSTISGVAAHMAAYTTALSSTRILAHATAGSGAWAGETTDTRFERYADLAGIPAAEINAETGSTTMGHIDTTGQNVVDMLRTVERTEAGVMFDARDGTLTLHSRSHRYAATAAVTLDMAKQEVEADYSPRLDASALFNDITVSGVVSAHLKDDASIEANGLATASFTTASEDDDEPLNLAGWALLQFATPKPRVPTLTVNALAQVGKTVDCADVMAVTLGDKVTVTNHPAQAQATTTSFFVEGGTEVYGPESLTITWNVSPSSPDDLALIVGDATRGVVGTNYVAL